MQVHAQEFREKISMPHELSARSSLSVIPEEGRWQPLTMHGNTIKDPANQAAAAEGKVFSKLDLRDAYYRAGIQEGVEWETTFTTPPLGNSNIS